MLKRWWILAPLAALMVGCAQETGISQSESIEGKLKDAVEAHKDEPADAGTKRNMGLDNTTKPAVKEGDKADATKGGAQ